VLPSGFGGGLVDGLEFQQCRKHLGGQNAGTHKEDAHKQNADKGNATLLMFHFFSCTNKKVLGPATTMSSPENPYWGRSHAKERIIAFGPSRTV
jgi:hypothetical protein